MWVAKSHVRAVSVEDEPVDMTMTLAEAIESGSYVEILRAQRRDIVECLPDERGPARAALHRQLALISKEIQALDDVALQAKLEAAEDERGEAEAWNAEAI